MSRKLDTDELQELRKKRGELLRENLTLFERLKTALDLPIEDHLGSLAKQVTPCGGEAPVKPEQKT